MKRISVVGTSGSGKTTVARKISRILGIPHIELDALHWEPNWTEAACDVFLERVARATEVDEWVVDGNYSASLDSIWKRADTVVWLDFPFHTVMRQLLIRTARRVISQEELWSGNRERFLAQLLPGSSIFWWAIKTYGRRKRDYPILLRKPEHAHLDVIHLKSPGETGRWIEALETPPDFPGF